MVINTKFSPKDKVFVLKGDVAVELEVRALVIERTDTITDIRYSLVDEKGSSCVRSEEQVFATKGELAASL